MEPAYDPKTVEEVFRDFKGRRTGLIKALTTDVEKFFQNCDPDRDNLSLYGFPNETWEVNLPAEEVPPEIPEPALGINFAREGMQEKDWLAMVAVHSDAWLISVAFYFGSRFGFDKNDRKRLFSMINELPTIFEVVSRKANVKSPLTSHSHSKSKPNSSSKSQKGSSSVPTKPHKKQSEPESESESAEEGLDEEPPIIQKVSNPKKKENSVSDSDSEEDHGETLCGACGENYASNEFWICCDVCEKWFHGKCVKITPAKAQHIKQYKCPACTSTKRARVN
ncbi:hypothetical protein LUZ60_006441 [Juncus effusus]|nr:hypothetical protein LUZ60_006441 [Juncus effusus]